MPRTGLRICDSCRALESVGDDVMRPCRICGYQPEAGMAEPEMTPTANE